LIPSILFYKGKLKPYKESLDFQQKDIPYFFVLDKNGKIVYAASGRYTPEKMAKVEEIVGE
jgi:thioredoxin-related protein